METISYKNIISRKEHSCNFCNGIIKKGELYNNQVNKFEDTIYTWKSHIHCMELVSILDMNTGDGVTDECFAEMIREEYDTKFFDDDTSDIDVATMAKTIYEIRKNG